MRWFRIRKAKIEPELRTTLEQYGAPVMQQILSQGSNFRYKGQATWIEAVRDSVLDGYRPIFVTEPISEQF